MEEEEEEHECCTGRNNSSRHRQQKEDDHHARMLKGDAAEAQHRPSTRCSTDVNPWPPRTTRRSTGTQRLPPARCQTT